MQTGQTAAQQPLEAQPRNPETKGSWIVAAQTTLESKLRSTSKQQSLQFSAVKKLPSFWQIQIEKPPRPELSAVQVSKQQKRIGNLGLGQEYLQILPWVSLALLDLLVLAPMTGSWVDPRYATLPLNQAVQHEGSQKYETPTWPSNLVPPVK